MAVIYSKNWDDGVLGGDDNQNVALSSLQSQTSPNSIRFNLVAQSGRWKIVEQSGGTDPAVVVYKAYVYFASLPSADSYWLCCVRTGGGDGGLAYSAADAKFCLADNGVGTKGPVGGPTITTGTWYTLDCRVDMTDSPWEIDGRINGTALTQFSSGFAAGTIPDYRLGPWINNITVDAYMDTLDVSHTFGDYPLLGSAAGPGDNPPIGVLGRGAGW